jgi:hypothetical protein
MRYYAERHQLDGSMVAFGDCFRVVKQEFLVTPDEQQLRFPSTVFQVGIGTLATLAN